jgi:D-glycero-D-manno-heptose 1,7-bisphosphate phosphatase
MPNTGNAKKVSGKPKMKIVFCDRDGVINKFPGEGDYVTKEKDFHFLPGVKEAVKLLTDSGFSIFIISNQACVGKGLLTAAELKRITRKMTDGIESAGGSFKKILYCTHKPDVGCDCRKPGIGMIKQALKSVNKTLAYAPKTFFIGDTDRDIVTGHNAGCNTIFVTTGRDKRRDVLQWNIKPDYIVKDLKDAAKIIINENSSHPRHCRSGTQKSR